MTQTNFNQPAASIFPGQNPNALNYAERLRKISVEQGQYGLFYSNFDTLGTNAKIAGINQIRIDFSDQMTVDNIFTAKIESENILTKVKSETFINQKFVTDWQTTVEAIVTAFEVNSGVSATSDVRSNNLIIDIFSESCCIIKISNIQITGTNPPTTTKYNIDKNGLIGVLNYEETPENYNLKDQVISVWKKGSPIILTQGSININAANLYVIGFGADRGKLTDTKTDETLSIIGAEPNIQDQENNIISISINDDFGSEPLPPPAPDPTIDFDYEPYLLNGNGFYYNFGGVGAPASDLLYVVGDEANTKNDASKFGTVNSVAGFKGYNGLVFDDPVSGGFTDRLQVPNKANYQDTRKLTDIFLVEWTALNSIDINTDRHYLSYLKPATNPDQIWHFAYRANVANQFMQWIYYNEDPVLPQAFVRIDSDPINLQINTKYIIGFSCDFNTGTFSFIVNKAEPGLTIIPGSGGSVTSPLNLNTVDPVVIGGITNLPNAPNGVQNNMILYRYLHLANVFMTNAQLIAAARVDAFGL